MTWRDVVRDEAEKAGMCAPSDGEADNILWEHTGFPEFWNIPADGATAEECCRKQVREYYANPQGIRP